MNPELPTANWSWCQALVTTLHCGNQVQPRGQLIRETVAYKSVIDLDDPVITIPQRKLNYKFMIEEALWILEGRNDVFHKNMASFSDTGRVLQGAYGPKISEQAKYIVEKLAEDSESRQAVINLWRESPRQSKDVPCTLSIQFLWRKKLQLIVAMRSSDLWLGYPYDIFSFTMVAHLIRLLMKSMGFLSPLELGGLYLYAGSLHVYEKDVESAIECSKWSMARSKFNMNLYDLDTPDDLLEYLRALRDDKGARDNALGLT